MKLSKEKSDLIDKFIKEGMSYKEVSEQVGCAISTVSYFCKKYNLTSAKKVNRYSDDIIEKALEYYKTHTAKRSNRKIWDG